MKKDRGKSASDPQSWDQRLDAHDSNADPWSVVAPYLPGLLLEAIGRQPDRRPPWIESVQGSLVLADISGFTPMSERLAQSGKEGAEWLTNIVNSYFSRMLHIAQHYGCSNVRFGGDALLLFFQGERSTDRAVSTAMAMQRATRSFNLFRAGEHRFRLRMTVGVHNGSFWSAVAGVPGLRMQHFLLGSDTSLLAEIQASAAPGELLISSHAMSALSIKCSTVQRGDGFQVIGMRTRMKSGRKYDPWASRPLPSAREGLLDYLPPPIVQALRAGYQDQSLEGEHRKVTIMFINLMGINETMDLMGPEPFVTELQRYLQSLVQLTDRYGGFLVDNDVYTKGIKLIVVFGAPVAHEQDSANALRLALDLGREVGRLKLKLQQRIGINSGFVFVGNLGSAERRQYTMMGDAVNLSARLMSSAQPEEVIVSERVVVEAGPTFTYADIAPLKVKGKKEPVHVSRLTGEGGADAAKKHKLLNALVGRQAEMDLFRRTCAQVESRNGRILRLTGEAGMGKSRLVAEFMSHLVRGGWSTYRAECHTHTSNQPFAVWVEALESLFDIEPADTGGQRVGKVEAAVKRLVPHLFDASPLLNPLLGLSIPQSNVLRALDDETRRRWLLDLIAGLFQARSGVGPTALILEDIHWADRSSLEVISRVSAGIEISRLLLCLTSRPGQEIMLESPLDSIVSVDLGELPQADALKIVQQVLESEALPAGVAEAVVSKAQGNPLFLEEVARSIRHSKNVAQVTDGMRPGLPGEAELFEIPDRLQGLIMSRIDALSKPAKDTLRAAAVVGDTFDPLTMGELLDLDPPSVDMRLRELVDLDLAYMEPHVAAPLYHFKHALIQEVAYDSLLFARRRQMHYRVASHIENTQARHLDRFYEILVHHYDRSAEHRKTRIYAVKAAAKAKQVFAHEEAVAYYRRGLRAVDEKGAPGACLRSYFLERIGGCYEMAGLHEKASTNLLQSLRSWRTATRAGLTPATTLADLTDKWDPKAREALLCHRLSVSCERNSDYDSSLRWLHQAARTLPARRSSLAANIQITRSVALFRKGRHREAIISGRKGLQLSRRRGDMRQIAYAHNMLASSYLELGDLKKAIAHRQSAVDIYDRLEDLSGQAAAHNNLGACHQLLGNLSEALHHYEVALKADETVGNPTAVAITHNNIAEVLLVRGEINDAIAHLQKVVDTYDRLGDPLAATGLALVNLCRAYQAQEDYKRAQECLHRGRQLLRKAGARPLLTEAKLQEAELALDSGRIGAATRAVKRGLLEARELDMKLLESRALRILGRIAMASGDYTQAKQRLEESALLASRLHADHETALSLIWLAELCRRRHATGDAGQEQRLRRKAAVILGRMGISDVAAGPYPQRRKRKAARNRG
jgi:class 3 adenylate cyclase/tetratricopeptide (TPR) repeat protein